MHYIVLKYLLVFLWQPLILELLQSHNNLFYIPNKQEPNLADRFSAWYCFTSVMAFCNDSSMVYWQHSKEL